MTGDVDRALHHIVVDQGDMTEESAKDYIARMKNTGVTNATCIENCLAVFSTIRRRLGVFNIHNVLNVRRR
jgi:hypothetical protein